MGASDSDPPQHGEGDAEQPLTVDLLADLQAGLLDDEAAARVRSRVRADPEAEGVLRALNRVRTDLGDLGAAGADSTSAPPTATVTATPRSSAAAHSARPPIHPGRLIAGIAGLGALVVAVGLGTSALLDAPPPTSGTPATADHMTVPGPAAGPTAAIPLSHAQILELLNHGPDYGTHGALEDEARRASCLRGLGYPSSASVLGARPVEMNSRPAVLLVLPGDTPQDLAVFVVGLNCSAVDTGLLASTQIPRS
jgi:hypothetical protein